MCVSVNVCECELVYSLTNLIIDNLHLCNSVFVVDLLFSCLIFLKFALFRWFNTACSVAIILHKASLVKVLLLLNAFLFFKGNSLCGRCNLIYVLQLPLS